MARAEGMHVAASIRVERCSQSAHDAFKCLSDCAPYVAGVAGLQLACESCVSYIRRSFRQRLGVAFNLPCATPISGACAKMYFGDGSQTLLIMNLYLISQVSTFVYTTGAVVLGILVLLALLSFQTSRTIIGPIVGAIATREFLSVAVILGSIICVVFCVTFLVASALHDLADGTRSLYNYIVANAYTDDNTSTQTFLCNVSVSAI